jgi:uncharacterized membrane protein
MERVVFCIVALVAFASCADAGPPPAFEILAPNAQFLNGMQAFDVSSDGNTVVGFGFTNARPVEAFVWRRGTGVTTLASPLPRDTRALAISPDGSHAAGWSFPTFTLSRMTRWNLASNTFDHPAAAGLTSEGNAISNGGRYVAGSFDARPVRWDSLTNSVDVLTNGSIYSSGRAFDITPDGSTITGDAAMAGGNAKTFRWTASSGLVAMPDVPGSVGSTGSTISADGLAIGVTVTYPDLPSGESNLGAFRWSMASGLTDLGRLPGSSFASPLGISGDGSILVGNSGGNAFLWTQATGMLDLNVYLPALGIDLDRVHLQQAISISADGRTIVGDANDLVTGQTIAWIATIPTPNGALVFVSGVCVAARRRR